MNRGIEQYYDTELKEKPLPKESGMTIRDLSNQEYPLQATITYHYDLNGNQSISSNITANKVNDLFVDNISEMWVISDNKGTEYKVIYHKKKGKGERLTVEIKAIPVFFDKFNTDRIYEIYNQSMTAQEYFTLLFNGTGFNFTLVDSFNAVEWEGLGQGTTKLELFKNGLNRYKAEFKLEGNMVYLQTRVGRDTNIMYRYQLNASNIVKEVDASNFWTYAKGFGDYDEGDEQNANLIREYTSPLATILGFRHAPPIYDGRIKNADTMDNALKELVDESLKISVSATIHDLRKQGYNIAQAEVGDRVFLIDERIGFNEEVRAVSLNITKDWLDNVLDLNITFGSEGLSKRHQSNINTGIKRINDIMEGRGELPYNVLPEAIKRASEALLGAMTELEVTELGIIARDITNPNNLVIYNSAGLGVSRDGGNTFENAITYLGVNTNLLTAGDIHTNNIRIIGDTNFYWDGTGLRARDSNNSNKYVQLDSSGLYISRGAMTIERPDGYKVVTDGILTGEYAVQSPHPPFQESGVEIVNQWARVSTTARKRINRYTFMHSGRYLRFSVARYVAQGGGAQGVIYIEDNTTGEELWSLSFDNDSTHDSAQYSQEYNIDLGVPTGLRKSVIVRARTTVTDYPVSLHITSLSIWG